MVDEKYWLMVWQVARSGKERLVRISSRISRVWKAAVWAAFGGDGVGVRGFWGVDMV